MLKRERTLKSGKVWVGYYYNGRDANGKRRETPLGTDLFEAKLKWAQLEQKPKQVASGTMGHVFDRYERDILPNKAPRTQQDNIQELALLRKVFNDAPLEQITTAHLAQYRDARGKTAPVRANREIALFSHAFNIAREWGYTNREDPCRGLRKNKETPRDFYVDDAVFNAVLDHAVTDLRCAMRLAYLTGQRPADVRKMQWADIVDGHIVLQQNKTNKKLRVAVVGQLQALLAEIKAGSSIGRYIICTDAGKPLSYAMLRQRFDAARILAAKRHPDLADRIKIFQFRDIRAKSASDTDIAHASALLGHTTQKITAQVYRRLGQTVKPVN